MKKGSGSSNDRNHNNSRHIYIHPTQTHIHTHTHTHKHKHETKPAPEIHHAEGAALRLRHHQPAGKGRQARGLGKGRFGAELFCVVFVFIGWVGGCQSVSHVMYTRIQISVRGGRLVGG